MPEEIDPELDKLLKEIEDAEESIPEDSPKASTTKVGDDEEESPHVEEEEVKAEVKAEKEEIEDILELESNLAYRNRDEEEDDEDDDIIDAEEVEAEVIAGDLEREKLEKSILGLVKQHVNSVDKMFEEAESDRKNIDNVLALLIPKIESDDYKGTDLLAITSLIQTKTDVSRNRASLMDSIAKLFASVKNNDSVGFGTIDNTGEDDISQDELDKILG